MEIEFNNVNYSNKLKDINYKFMDNKVTSIIGKSGSGKSLIGFAIMGLLELDNGNIKVNGKLRNDDNELKKNIGYVMERPWEQLFCKTVHEEIAFGLKQFKFKLDKMNNQILDSLKMVGLDESYILRDVDTLSNGELMRVVLASVLILNPKVLILDEPTIYLDGNGKENLVKLIKLLKNKYKKTIIIMTKDIDFVPLVSDNYIVMDMGKIIKKGNINNMKNDKNFFIDKEIGIPKIQEFVEMIKENYKIDVDDIYNLDKVIEGVVKVERR